MRPDDGAGRSAALRLFLMILGLLLVVGLTVLGGLWLVHWWNNDVVLPYQAPDGEGGGGPRSTDDSRVLDLRMVTGLEEAAPAG
jgi:hypothetical protein